ncbi:glucose-1-phosphate cytidylyltransferase (rfbF) [Halalkalicoccus jeotgali B3]|uniref:Glucose-1-phosphate cytidylyltransferase (RfbF) n=1 Tax=Halalkalicoccus jeotgali (strain DSM 18796 / CECT 7217 / JCM 14584 / KCTC 4019 / B3) TaxID=795797 RepID=D8J6E3_HALJB|nr:glucose-1-phosphate cytidylyltransferase (rfbF) [Halalkalicoccus jeotgali B3]ELY37957.1 glucose-1-phosphate cytidylyltransferase (rfbF) [Halalkalicoccus jeotgali B3]
MLAAGLGSRLQPLTDGTPKTLLAVNGHPILGHILDSLADAGYERVTVVTGYEAEQVRSFCQRDDRLDFEFVHNETFQQTNNSYSLWLARERLREGFVLVNSDTLFPTACLDRLREREGSALVVDRVTDLTDESMKVAVEDGRVRAIGKGIDRADGEFIGLCKFEPDEASALIRCLDNLVERGLTNEWYETAFDRLATDRSIGVVEVHEEWIEIDDREDLRTGQQLWGEA